MSNVTPVTHAFPFMGIDVHVFVDSNAHAWFRLADIAYALGIRNAASSRFALDATGIIEHRYLSKNNIKRSMVYVSEPNMYRIVFKSRKESAEQFQKWVFNEVLPAVRSGSAVSVDKNEDMVGVQVAVADATNASLSAKEKQKMAGFENEPTADSVRKFRNGDDLIPVARFASVDSGIGRTTVFRLLKAYGWINNANLPTMYAEHQDLLQSITFVSRNDKGGPKTTYHVAFISLKGRKAFFDNLPSMLAAIKDDSIRNKAAIRVCKAGFSHLLLAKNSEEKTAVA